MVDESYQIVGNSVDESTKTKIINHEYVDFAQLIPHDKLTKEEDKCMELVNKGGLTFFVPVSKRESNGNITNFNHWEQAFRVFANMYMRAYPDHATELIQYNHLIHTASLSFTWDNIYHYDHEFRLHLSNFPQRNWGVILQQTWMVYLKDRIPSRWDENKNHQGNGSHNNGSPG